MRNSLSPRSSAAPRRGFSLIELMAAIAISGILLTILAALLVNSARSILAMTNYTELDQVSRNALDTLTRDIRQGKDVLACSSSSISMSTISGGTFAYTYDAGARTLTRTGGGMSKVLLTGCDSLSFKLSQRNPTNGFNFYPATNLTTAKLVDVNWRCSRDIQGQQVNTESIQTARIVVRN